MFLALDSDEQEIANASSAFLGKEYPLQRLHVTPQDPNTLAAFSELGWLGLGTPEEHGGIGLSIVEEMLFFRELGRVAGPMAVLFQVLGAVAAQGRPEICSAIISGAESVALLVNYRAGESLRLIGDANAAYALAVTESGVTLFSLRGESLEARPCMDQSVAMWVGAAEAVSPLQTVDGAECWQKAQICSSAMMLGLAETALEMIVEYAKDRETFGRKIGAYQAVRHPCADMAVRVEAARCQLFYAATALKEGQADADMLVDAARLLAERAAKANVDSNIQLHGGIGVTDELDAHLLLKRANLLVRLFGSSKRCYHSLLDVGSASATTGEE